MGVGDKVSFVVTRMTERSISYVVKEGVLVKYGKDYSELKMKNGNIIVVRTNTIRIQGQKNALTESLLNANPTKEADHAQN